MCYTLVQSTIGFQLFSCCGPLANVRALLRTSRAQEIKLSIITHTGIKSVNMAYYLYLVLIVNLLMKIVYFK